jgi:hypothetical protein
MIRVLTAAAMLVASSGISVSAPSQLKGKSVRLSWTENRIQRLEGHQDFRSVSINMEMAVYVSAEGRVFNRMQSNSGANEQAPGQASLGGRIPSFNGQTMTIMQPLRGLARRIVVEFGGDFATCAASVILGKESGGGSGYIRAFATGARQEVRSASASGASCSVRNGNVFQ